MSHRTTILIGISFLFLGYFVLSSRFAGIAAVNSLDATGSPLSSLLCSTCHNGGSFNASASLQILDGNTPITSYVPGNTYMMTLQVSGTAPHYGGQAVALTSSNGNAGTMGIPSTSETQVVDLNGVSYLEQSAKSSSGTFSVPWTAPTTGTGDVNLYFIGNAVDGISTSGDDVTPSMSMTLTEAALATCFDGIQNQDETGIDCGGVCPSCIPNFYVDDTATGNNDGSSWMDAFTDLQSALAVGAGGIIHIAEGIYKPTSGTNRGASLDIPNAVTVLGGYPNGGGDRNPSIHETILSGDIDNVASYDGNSFHVVRVKDVDNVILDGITIQEGNANNANSFGRARGGGLYVINSTVTLMNTTVTSNKAIYGGGLFATLSPNVTISHSNFTMNESEFGSALYHSNTTNMYIQSSRITDNNSTFRCAIEINNSLYTLIENSIIANNNATNANAIAFIATNRNQTCDIYNSTILGGTTNKNLISLQIGNNDELGVNIYNSIIAHQNLSFDKAFVAFNNNILNLHTENCYIQGSSVIGTGLANIFSDIAGDLLLNADYSVAPCSPAVNAGNDANINQLTTDIDGNNRLVGTVDIGAYEAQSTCLTPRAFNHSNDASFSIYPNPTSDILTINTKLEDIQIQIYNALGQLSFSSSQKEIDIRHLANGIYIINLVQNGKMIDSKKVIKR